MSDVTRGTELTLLIEKAVAGGQMLARHEGQVVLVSGAIPGERVRARVVRMASRTAHAEVLEVLEASPDRRPGVTDPRCGGQAFAHIAYARQLALKAGIVRDAWERIARLPWPGDPTVVPSPEHGYRMRARLHGDHGRIGFLREGSHQVCDADAGGQLLPSTVEWVREVERRGVAEGLGITALELTENIAGTARASYLELQTPPSAAFVAAVSGAGPISWGRAAEAPPSRGRTRPVARVAIVGPGEASLVDGVSPSPGAAAVPLRRHARAFFQGNRFLLEPFVHHVVAAVERGPVLDLYAGVGLFGLSTAAAGRGPVVCVEGDAVSGSDLIQNTTSFGVRAHVVREPVERYVASAAASRLGAATVILDPPRTGMAPEVARAVGRLAGSRLIFVSCDPATFARDARVLDEAGFSLSALTVFDLFPNTAHVEAVGVFDRR